MQLFSILKLRGKNHLLRGHHVWYPSLKRKVVFGWDTRKALQSSTKGFNRIWSRDRFVRESRRSNMVLTKTIMKVTMNERGLHLFEFNSGSCSFFACCLVFESWFACGGTKEGWYRRSSMPCPAPFYPQQWPILSLLPSCSKWKFVER